MSKWRETFDILSTLGFQLPMDLAHLDFTAITQLARGPDLGLVKSTLESFRSFLSGEPKEGCRSIYRASEEAGNLFFP